VQYDFLLLVLIHPMILELLLVNSVPPKAFSKGALKSTGRGNFIASTMLFQQRRNT